MDLKFEKRIWKKGYEIVIGVDEAGRGPLAGPVFAGAVALKAEGVAIYDSRFMKLLRGVNDSKKLSAKKRQEIYEELIKSRFIAWAEGRVGPVVIDRINILEATKLAMKRAVCGLSKKLTEVRPLESFPEDGPLLSLKQKKFLLLDGNFPLNLDIPQKSIIRGDQKVFSIAAASIIAKVRRDRLMVKYAKRFPPYGFEKHKGYPTRLHRQMLVKYGPCKIHRESFRLSIEKKG